MNTIKQGHTLDNIQYISLFCWWQSDRHLATVRTNCSVTACATVTDCMNLSFKIFNLYLLSPGLRSCTEVACDSRISWNSHGGTCATLFFFFFLKRSPSCSMWQLGLKVSATSVGHVHVRGVTVPFKTGAVHTGRRDSTVWTLSACTFSAVLHFTMCNVDLRRRMLIYTVLNVSEQMYTMYIEVYNKPLYHVNYIWNMEVFF